MSDKANDDNKFTNPPVLRGAMALAAVAVQLKKSAEIRDALQRKEDAERELSTPAPFKPKP